MKSLITDTFVYRLDTEANLQAEFYMACKQQNKAVVLNLYTPFGFLDAACLSPDRTRLLGIVETKRGPNTPALNTKQLARYRASGVPVFLLWREKDIQSVLQKAFAGKGKTLESLISCPILLKRNRKRTFGGTLTLRERTVRDLPVPMDDNLILR